MTYKLEGFNLDQMLATLGRSGAIWTRKGGVTVHFSHRELNCNAKAWYSFLYAKLLPTTHVSDVIKDCALVLYAIVIGKSINVGKVIKDLILYAIQGSSSGGLPHPSLIYRLCKETRVRWIADETLIQPKALINQRIMDQFQNWEDDVIPINRVRADQVDPTDEVGPSTPPQ